MGVPTRWRRQTPALGGYLHRFTNEASGLAALSGPAPARTSGTKTPIALAAVAGASVGAALMYWSDPDQGRSRRTRAASHTRAVLRSMARQAGGKTSRHTRYLEGRLKGAAMKGAGHGRYQPESDADLREHLRQVIRSLPVASSDVNVDVCAGKASLRGQVQHFQDREFICGAVAGVPGVEEVEDFLHLPGEAAPNKMAVLGLNDQP